ncbi:MAG: hypothetical protein U1E27_10570 [Kiritimatiellia bacterium]|nr:hypothetical protein [Kiritimatiellia bacterium]
MIASIRPWAMIALLVGALAMVGCEDKKEGSPVDVAGKWSLTQTFDSGKVTTFSVTFAQNEKILTGSSSYGPVSGSISGKSIQFTIKDEDLKTFSGKVSGSTMSGTFYENFEDTLYRDGIWSAVKKS